MVLGAALLVGALLPLLETGHTKRKYAVEPITIQLTPEQCIALSKLLNSVNGMENARVFLPIYDALKQAIQKTTASNGALPIKPDKPGKSNTRDAEAVERS